MYQSDPTSQDYINAIELVKNNPFNIQKVNPEIVDDRLLRLARRGNAWAVDAWGTSLEKQHKALGKERSSLVFQDMGVIRPADLY